VCARSFYSGIVDDLSLCHDDAHYKSLKAVLDGGISSGRPENVVLLCTSNPRATWDCPAIMIENERGSAIQP